MLPVLNPFLTILLLLWLRPNHFCSRLCIADDLLHRHNRSADVSKRRLPSTQIRRHSRHFLRRRILWSCFHIQFPIWRFYIRCRCSCRGSFRRRSSSWRDVLNVTFYCTSDDRRWRVSDRWSFRVPEFWRPTVENKNWILQFNW